MEIAFGAKKKNTLTGMRGQFQSAPHQGGKAIKRIVKAVAYIEPYKSINLSKLAPKSCFEIVCLTGIFKNFDYNCTQMMKLKDDIKVALVGPCSSGKSTLRKHLVAAGFRNIKMPTQEHSYVKDMWQKLTKPDLLIYLDVDYPTTLIRRPHIDLGPERVETQNDRLSHARLHADFYLDTSPLTPEEIGSQVLEFLGTKTLKI